MTDKELRMQCLQLAAGSSLGNDEKETIKTAKEFYDFVRTGVRKKTEEEVSEANSPRGGSHD